MLIKEIIDSISEYPCIYICLTGGEPLMQDETINLIKALQKIITRHVLRQMEV